MQRVPLMANRGVFLPEAGLWLDPWDRQEVAFVSHAHSDHFCAHNRIICSKSTATLIRARFGGTHQIEARTFGRAWSARGYRFKLLPAGHTLGSAQIHVTRLSDGASLLYSGDFKLRGSRTSEPVRTETADILIMETTFGRPEFRFPSATKIRNALVRFCRNAIDEGERPILIAYSLGKTQELMAQLADGGFSFVLHPAAFEMTRAYETHGVKFPPYEPFVDGVDPTGKVFIVPPGSARSQAIRKLRPRRLAACTGWALTPGARFRYQVDEVFPLSDHADFPELLRYVELVQPKLVLTTHGSAAEFARILRERGWDAWSLGADDQMEFKLGFGSGERMADAEEDDGAGTPDDSEFGCFVRACDAAASAPGRRRKIDTLAAYLRALNDPVKAALSARFFVGRGVARREDQAAVATGAAIIRLALAAATGLSPRRAREISARHNDLGRAAFLMLMHGQKTAPRPITLDDVTTCIARLIETQGPIAKAAIVEAYFRQMTPGEGSCLVRILAGDMRNGITEGLIEEALAEAFHVDPVLVRDVHMLTDDLGETARLAALGELATVGLRVFQPLRPMLLTPEDSTTAIWDRRIPAAGEAGARPSIREPVWIEERLEGIRAQLHKCGSRVEVFSRELRCLTPEFPEIARAATTTDDIVLDGVIVGLGAGNGGGLSASRKRQGRLQPDFFFDDTAAVRFVVFDLLWHNGESLLNRPLRERRARLAGIALPAPMEIIRASVAHDPIEIDAALLAARSRGVDRLVAKDPDSAYTAGRRGRAWLELNKSQFALDVVVVKAGPGSGRRSHLLSDYTLAVRDPESGALRVVGKTSTGLTDADIESLTTHFLGSRRDRTPRARPVHPEIVLEVTFESILPNPRNSSGFGLRSPHIKSIRTGITMHEIDTLATVRTLAGGNPELPPAKAAFQTALP